MKFFWTFNSEVVRQCQDYTDFSTVEHLARERKVKFVTLLQYCPSLVIRTMIDILNAHRSANWSVL